MQYVLTYVEQFGSLVMVRKNRPDWQAGKLNLPGGHIEDGEQPCQAAARELFEETGLLAKQLPQVGTIYCDGHTVYVFQARGTSGNLEQKTDETVEIVPSITLNFRDDLVSKNIRIMHGLIMSGLCGWSLFDDDSFYEVRIPKK